MITYDMIRKDEAIRTYITRADESLIALGYTEHSFAHVTKVAEMGGYILETLGYPEKDIELVKDPKRIQEIEPQCSKDAKYATSPVAQPPA